MSESQMEVLTWTDKDKRDQVFADYRANGNAMEREVVKFSDVIRVTEMVDGQELFVFDEDPITHVLRRRYKTIYGIAYPRTPRFKPSRRNKNYPRKSRFLTALAAETHVPDIEEAA